MIFIRQHIQTGTLAHILWFGCVSSFLSLLLVLVCRILILMLRPLSSMELMELLPTYVYKGECHSTVFTPGSGQSAAGTMGTECRFDWTHHSGWYRDTLPIRHTIGTGSFHMAVGDIFYHRLIIGNRRRRIGVESVSCDSVSSSTWVSALVVVAV